MHLRATSRLFSLFRHLESSRTLQFPLLPSIQPTPVINMTANLPPSESGGGGSGVSAQNAEPVYNFPLSEVPKNPLGEGRYIKTAAALIIG